MTLRTGLRYRSGIYDHRDASLNARPQRVLGGAALACVALACAWTICTNHGADPLGANFADRFDNLADSVASRGDKLAVAASRQPAVSNRYVSLLDPHYLGAPAGMFAQNVPARVEVRTAAVSAPPAPSRSAQQSVQLASASPDVHLPAPTAAAPPLQLRLPRTVVNRAIASASAEPTIFEKLFGRPSPMTLAYASADDSALAGTLNTGRYDRSTAIYDISAHTVYMPDGRQLEAHSGYGSLLDDPQHPEAHNRGVTPPAVYDLQPRESIFHGVQALRLIPTDESKVYGRSGLLAHSFMLGPNGDSNGCVSFRNYDAFLQAYQNHEIKRLVVVSRLN